MSVQILGKGKKVALKRRHARLRKHISGTPELPRLVVPVPTVTWLPRSSMTPRASPW